MPARAAKKAAKKAAKPKKAKGGLIAKVATAAIGAKSMISGGGVRAKGSRAGGRRRKRSALWYAREVARLRLKRKYDKEKMRV